MKIFFNTRLNCIYTYTLQQLKCFFENFLESTNAAIFLEAVLAVETKYKPKSNLEVMERLQILED